ncbi:MAG: multiheme c-type cytochrome [Candidatus Poribacteria bacterium]|nr:multiheme c-type cytochrome [Candidatus Poribacteria bacterium]
MTLVFSGGELGYLEPCGCSEGQLGGIARRDNFLQHLRENENIVLSIANGNFIEDASPQSELKAEIGFLALTDMEYIAYNVGERDLQLGTAQLTALSEQNLLPLISANLYQGTSPAFTPYLLHTVQLPDDVVKIAIVGLISPSYIVYAENTDLLIREPNAILTTLMPELTENANVIVCLFNGTEVEASKLHNNFPTLDIVVVSNDNTEMVPPSTLHDRQFVNTRTKGKSICSVRIYFDINGHPIIEDPQQHLLNEQIPDSQRMIKLLTLYQQMVTDANLAASMPQKPEKIIARFVGNATCKTCHLNEWTSWKVTKHAHAYHTLEVAGHETDPDCLTCHTVGFGFSSGFLSIEETPNHRDVGCENCHGAGRTHVKQQSETSNTINTSYGKVTEATCLTCHTMENSPKFDLKAYFPKIIHTLEGHQ